MADRAKYAFGSSQNIQTALDSGVIDAFDILFLDGDTKPKVGWIDKQGNPVIVDNECVVTVEGESLPESGEVGKVYIFGDEGYFWNGTEFINMCKPTDLTELEEELATKASAKEVDAKFGEIETTLDDVANAAHTHEKIKYEFSSVPVGTLVDYRENEIRVMCPVGSVFTKQSVGADGNPNNYYATFKTYAPNDDVVGYIEHLGDQVDSEILTDLKTDEYGRRYQPTWLAIASYDESTDTWTYYGKNSSANKYIGWDYQIDWYNADGVMIASDSVRINLSNENCHSSIEPYYVGAMMSEIDKKIAEVSAIEVVEF